jgi:hypothetical protein
MARKILNRKELRDDNVITPVAPTLVCHYKLGFIAGIKNRLHLTDEQALDLYAGYRDGMCVGKHIEL